MKKDMKKNLMKRIVAMIIDAVMLFSLAAFVACSKKQDDTEIRIAALKGPTGMGMVKLQISRITQITRFQLKHRPMH